MAWRVNVQLADTTHPELEVVDSMITSATIDTSIKGLLEFIDSKGRPGWEVVGFSASKEDALYD